MAAPTDDSTLKALRAALVEARTGLVGDSYQLDVAQDVLTDALRTGDPEPIAAAQEALKGSQDAVTAAREAERGVREDLAKAISTWLTDPTKPPTTPPAWISPAEDLSRLDGDTPLILFPVRMETRFDPPNAPTILKVRIYPDEIFLNTHEEALTPAERQAGVDFYDSLDLTDEGAHRERWRTLASHFGPTRAAYIARVMTPPPTGGHDTRTDIGTRGAHWTRPGEAVLPDRWVVITYRGTNVVHTTLGSPIREPLAMTPDPGTRADEEFADVSNGFKIDKDLFWSLDFNEAKAAGMGVEITLDTVDDRTKGFDRLLVVGVKSSLDVESTTEHLEALFDAHHYTRGLGLVPQGTPTNNTTGKPVPFPSDDPTAAASFAIERVPAPTPGPADSVGGDGDFQDMTDPFGLPSGVFRNIENALVKDQVVVPQMNTAVWPATLGYYLQQILHPLLSGGQPTFLPATLAAAQSYFEGFVSGRGLMPAFRIGTVPYGVLPVLSLNKWTPISNRDDEKFEAKIVPTLRHLRQIWATTASIPHFRGSPPSQDPYDPLLNLLAQDASSKTVQVRNARGPLTQLNAALLLSPGGVSRVLQDIFTGLETAKTVGQPTWQSRGFTFEFDQQAHDFNGPLVADVLSDKPLESNYITALANATLEQLRDDTIVSGPHKPLLYMLLRHALIQEYLRVALTVTPANIPELLRVPLVELEIWLSDATAPDNTKPIPLFQFLAISIGTPDGPTTIFELAKKKGVKPYLDNLNNLADLPTAALHRLFSEALDICSHRLDAWITALGARRLIETRSIQGSSEVERVPSYLGGYGWLEDVRPRAHTIIDPGNGVGLVEIQAGNGGFIHAPSQAHARTAALLRAGRLVGKVDGDSKYAIDLSSERARRARRLIDEVRNGQPLGALLGYQFERGLADSGPPALQVTLHQLRNRFPLVPNKSGDDPYQEIDAVAARDVVDGNLLLTAYKADPVNFLKDPTFPKPKTQPFDVLVAQLERLKETMDGVADLVHAEAVYQVVQADVASAQANLDFLPHGQNPPDQQLLRTDGGGASVTHRVALLFTGTPTEADHWPAVASTARSAADPLVDAWVGQILGDPSAIHATVTFKDAKGAPQPPKVVALSELGLRPLDVVALAHASPDPNQASLLDRRILSKAFVSGWTEPTIAYDRQPKAVPGSIPEVLELARAVGAVLANARPLSREDLHTPFEAAQADEPPATEATALSARATAALTKLDTVVGKLDPNPTTDGLVQAAEFLPNAFPLLGLTDQQISDQAKGIAAELRRRKSVAAALIPSAAAPSETIAKCREALQELFGADFVGLAGIGAPPAAGEIAQSLAERATLLKGDQKDSLLKGDLILDQFVQQTARVREGMGRWRRLAIYTRSLGLPKARQDVVQLPFVTGESWVGAALPSGSGKLSVVLISPAATASPPTDTNANWSGLLLDQWVETVPLKERETGVAFHYDSPNAEAPQAVLVAVRSGPGAPGNETTAWSWDELLATVGETLDLAHIRSIEPRHLPLGQVLPAIYLASNTKGYNAGTNFAEQVAQIPAHGSP